MAPPSHIAAARPSSSASASTLVIVQRMVDLIERSYGERMTLNAVSAAFRGDPADLGRLFRSVVGVSVHEYLTRVRLDHAAYLINSSIKIESVALSVGYRSKKNFYRQFLRHFGVTPEAYRRRQIQPHGRAGGRNGARGAKAKNVAARYAAHFNSTACIIDIEARPNVKGRPSYVATPFVMADHAIQPFAAASECVEIVAETEAEALERASLFLEHRFGARATAPKRQDDKRTLAMRAPRC
jgi:AraC-like DNA-binding protein